jgi:hypothetical protein
MLFGNSVREMQTAWGRPFLLLLLTLVLHVWRGMPKCSVENGEEHNMDDGEVSML